MIEGARCIGDSVSGLAHYGLQASASSLLQEPSDDVISAAGRRGRTASNRVSRGDTSLIKDLNDDVPATMRGRRVWRPYGPLSGAPIGQQQMQKAPAW